MFYFGLGEVAHQLGQSSRSLSSEVPAVVDHLRCRVAGNVIRRHAAFIVSSLPKYAASGVIPPSDE